MIDSDAQRYSDEQRYTIMIHSDIQRALATVLELTWPISGHVLRLGDSHAKYGAHYGAIRDDYGVFQRDIRNTTAYLHKGQ